MTEDRKRKRGEQRPLLLNGGAVLLCDDDIQPHQKTDEDLFNDTMYTEVSYDKMVGILLCYDSDIRVKIAVGIIQNALLCAGVMIERPNSGRELDQQAIDWYSGTWSYYATRMMRQIYCLGFGASLVCPHKQYKGEPTELFLEKVTMK